MSKATRLQITPTEVIAVLRYIPDSGDLIWRERASDMFITDRIARSWNSRFSGRTAFTAKNNHGYFVGTIFGKLYTAHRVAWCISTGSWPAMQIDHINGNRTDNRIENLREVSNSSNHKNQKSPHNNSSGVVGVYLERRTGAWVAQIYHEGVRHNLGTFYDKSVAVAVRKQAELEMGYHPNHGRQNG